MKINKLAAIYNIWEVDHLKESILSIVDHVNLIVIIGQRVSNKGEEYDRWNYIKELCFAIGSKTPLIHKTIIRNYEPDYSLSAAKNEIQKRQGGIEIARDLNCSHFVALDCDEVHPDFAAAKQAYIESGAQGSVLQMITYFKHKNWILDPIESYFVPFIHELRTETVTGVTNYPYYVDPTRRINCENVVLLPQKIHHYSWVREDIERKMRNSSANMDLFSSNNLADYHSEEVENNPDGYFLKDFQRKIKVI